MPTPDFQSFLKPLVDIASDGEVHSLREARETVIRILKMTKEDLEEKLPSGTQTKFENRTAWARSYLTQAGILVSPQRGLFQITDRGIELYNRKLARIDVRVLNQYPEFVEFHSSKAGKNKIEIGEPPLHGSETPEEMLQRSYHSIRNELANDLLQKIKANTPTFFETLVVDLMVAMGYGGSRADAGKSIGQTGDEGIDGIIKEDKLGLDVIYLQAKRWEGTVGRPEIQKFVGALHGKRAKKGVFITTGKFSEEATNYVENIDPKVILIDGKTLTNYMIDFNLGVNTHNVYELKRIDSDYFTEE